MSTFLNSAVNGGVFWLHDLILLPWFKVPLHEEEQEQLMLLIKERSEALGLRTGDIGLHPIKGYYLEIKGPYEDNSL